MNTEVSEQKDWTHIDYQPAIPEHPPLPVLQHVPSGSTILDIGCEKGSNAIFLARHGFRVLGIDINGAAIEVARTRAQELSAPGSAQFRVADILEVSITDHFAVVLLIRVLTCFTESSDWDALLRRATQFLKPRGYIYIHDFLTSSDNEAYRIRYEAGAKLGWRTGNFQVNDTRGNRLFIAHHHSSAEVNSIRARFENLNYRRHDSLSMNGNACRMFEFLGQRRT